MLVRTKKKNQMVVTLMLKALRIICMILSREHEDVALLEADQLIGSPDGWNPPERPDGWSREIKVDQGETYFMGVDSPGGWYDCCC